LSAAPPTIGERRPELSSLDPVFAKALAKDPRDRYARCTDFADALRYRLAADDVGETRTWVAAKATPPARRSPLRPAVIVPAVLAVLLVVAVGFGLFELTRADDERAAPQATRTSAPAPSSPPVTPLPPPLPSTTTTASAAPETTSSDTDTTVTAVPAPVAVVGADCGPQGSTGTTANGSTAYCSTLQGTSATIWSLSQGDVPSPTVTVDPTEVPLPIEQETPIRVCMQQTGQTRRECREDIRRGNGLQ
jgi:serine/threonine-protein kinase